jgi:hypothetical protein
MSPRHRRAAAVRRGAFGRVRIALHCGLDWSDPDRKKMARRTFNPMHLA